MVQTHDNEANSPADIVGSDMRPIEPKTGWSRAAPTAPNMV
jgi:hypothetical protein